MSPVEREHVVGVCKKCGLGYLYLVMLPEQQTLAWSWHHTVCTLALLLGKNSRSQRLCVGAILPLINLNMSKIPQSALLHLLTNYLPSQASAYQVSSQLCYSVRWRPKLWCGGMWSHCSPTQQCHLWLCGVNTSLVAPCVGGVPENRAGLAYICFVK
ncbi:hypothetical protein E2C01_034103 [Portunus trituberculatus]|uniref:Uncharacterized protein n=1 Tax=Portunus trituberculatus TaxID=210409 RepID=A0A5B7F1X9_PORTR|nr:hypothetical protein [Portunus trituberculatus]